MKYAIFDSEGLLAQRLIEGIHEIPASAVAVSDDLFNRLLGEQDGLWKINANGEIEKHPLPEVVPDYSRIERLWRDAELQLNEWLVTRHRDELALERLPTLSTEQYLELLTYRQQLRDWPVADAFPDSAGRPVLPSWISEQTN